MLHSHGETNKNDGSRVQHVQCTGIPHHHMTPHSFWAMTEGSEWLPLDFFALRPLRQASEPLFSRKANPTHFAVRKQRPRRMSVLYDGE